MSTEHEEIDQEIDRDMGWERGDSARIRRKGGSPSKAAHWHALLAGARATSPFFGAIGRSLRTVGSVVFFPIVSPLGYSKRFDIHGDMLIVKRSLFWRIIDGVLTRILLTPVILAIFFTVVIYLSTHPKAVQAGSTPEAYGLYYKRIGVTASDGQGLSGWYVPPLKPGEVAFNQEEALLQKWPAAILVHGLGQTHDMYLPLAQQLHDVGFAVLLLDTRGQGESSAAAVTFGLRERLDILAGVRFLREQSNIDSGKICVVGQGIGATAALHAASLDSSLAAIVADGLPPKFDNRVRAIFENTQLPTRWMAPLYTVSFEITMRERLAQLDADFLLRNIRQQPLLFITAAAAPAGGEYATLQEVMSLAASTPTQHEVIVVGQELSARPTAERRITRFLANATGWRGPKIKGAEAIQKLLEAQVKP